MALYVHYGCGFCAPDGWLNFDASPTMRLQRIPLVGHLIKAPQGRFPENVKYGDIIKGLPVADASADGIYCSHTLEHLALEDCRIALRNSLRVLRSGGVFRAVMPDLRIMAQKYLSSTSPDASAEFMRWTWMAQEQRPRGLKAYVREFIGNGSHRWLWDFEMFSQELSTAGFTGIRKAVYGDSGDPIFGKVEDPGRWELAVAAHCVRP